MARKYESLWQALVNTDGASRTTEERLAMQDRFRYRVLSGKHPEVRVIYHPKFKGQITGYLRVDPKDWFVRKDGELHGPFAMRRHALPLTGKKKAARIAPGWYQTTTGWDVFTRDRADMVGVDLEGR